MTTTITAVKKAIPPATLPILWIDPARRSFPEGFKVLTRYGDVPRYSDSGLLFCSIAGLLNMLVLFDLVDRMLASGERR